MSLAREAGVDVDGIVKLPMVVKNGRRDEGVQVSLPCPDCVLLEKSLEEDMVGEDFSFADSGVGDDTTSTESDM